MEEIQTHPVPSITPAAFRKYVGGCHCGAVRFEVTLEAAKPLSRCNCSICMKVAPSSAIVQPSAFTLVAGKHSLGAYVWGAKISTRFFCKNCGVHCYGAGHLAEVGGDFVSVNANCLDDFELAEQTTVYWDGRHDNWHAGPRDLPWPVGSGSAAASS